MAMYNGKKALSKTHISLCNATKTIVLTLQNKAGEKMRRHIHGAKKSKRKPCMFVCVHVCLKITPDLHLQLTISTHNLSCTSHPRLIYVKLILS